MYLVVGVLGYDRPELIAFHSLPAARIYFEEYLADLEAVQYGWVQLYRLDGTKAWLVDEA